MTLENKFNKWVHINYLTNRVLCLDENDTISFIDIVDEFIKLYHLNEETFKRLIDYCNTHYKIKKITGKD